MQARDVMVSPVITVGKSATVRDVAKILLEKRISAVPVVDDAGKVVGIVTEGDLIHRAEAGTERPYSWWAHFLAGEAQGAPAEASPQKLLQLRPSILSLAADKNLDMLVIGAYGHSRIRDGLLGGVTREMLKTTTVPTLMSH